MSEDRNGVKCVTCRYRHRDTSEMPCRRCYPAGYLWMQRPRNEDLKAEIAKVIDQGGKEIDRVNKNIDMKCGELRALCDHTYSDGRSAWEPYGYYHNLCPLCDEMVEVPEEEVNRRIVEAQLQCQEEDQKR